MTEFQQEEIETFKEYLKKRGQPQYNQRIYSFCATLLFTVF